MEWLIDQGYDKKTNGLLNLMPNNINIKLFHNSLDEIEHSNIILKPISSGKKEAADPSYWCRSNAYYS